MVEKRMKSALPIYCVGLIFIVSGILFPMYKFSNFLITAAVSALVYFLAAKKVPDKMIMIESPVNTGDAAIDLAITTGREQLKKLEAITETIENRQISAYIDDLQMYGGKILNYVEQNPGDVKNVRQFMEYYLPTTIKLAENYANIKTQGVDGYNVDRAISKIEGVLGAMVDAFKKQLDNLFEDDALDIVTDINVMQRLLKSEGLLENDLDIRREGRDE